MLCYVFQNEGKLLCYFPIDGDNKQLCTDVEDCHKRQKEIFQIMTETEREQFLQFCHGKKRYHRTCNSILTEKWILPLQEKDTALFAERYDKRLSLFRDSSSFLQQLMDRPILQELNTQYSKEDALILILLQHKVSPQMGMDALILEKMPPVIKYLILQEELLYEQQSMSYNSDESFPQRAYKKGENGYLLDEALDVARVVPFLSAEMQHLPLFAQNRIQCADALEQWQDVRVNCKLSTFLYIYVVLTYFASGISKSCSTQVTMDTNQKDMCLYVSCDLNGQVQQLEAENTMEPLFRMFPLWRVFLLLLSILLEHHHLPYHYQITENTSTAQQFTFCFRLPILSPEEIVFRHKTDLQELTPLLSDTELLLFLLLYGEDVDFPE